MEHPQCLAAAEKWLDAGVGVLCTGDVGIGKTTVLAEIARRASERGVHVLAFQGRTAQADVPLSTFALHTLRFQPRNGERHSIGDVRDHFLQELQGRRNLLVVDDVDLVDATSLNVVQSLVDATGCGLVCSVRPGVPAGRWRNLLARGQPLARVPVETVGIRGVARILEDHLEGAVDMSLIASITAWSGGNARAVLALADAAVWAGTAARVDGSWAELAGLDEVPLEMVADAFCAPLAPAEVAALETLAWFGPLELPYALRLVGTEGLQRLMTLERISTYRTHGGQSVLVAVAPPCLAHAVRLGMDVVRRDDLLERFSATFEGPTVTTLPQWWTVSEHPRSSEDEPIPLDAVGSEPIPVVTERLAAQTVLRRDAWRAAPSVATATALLESLMNGGAQPDEVDDVFATTPVGTGEDLFTDVEFVVKRAQWIAFREGDVAQGIAELASFLDEAGPYEPLLRAQMLALDCARVGTAALLAASADFPREPVRENAWFALLRGGLLLENGRPAEALEMLLDWDLDADRDTGSVIDQLRVLRGDALLLDGQVVEALRYSQECLAQAYDRLDPLGIRMHSRGVATALLFYGDSTAAWQVLSTVLRLGPPGAVNVSYYQRILSMAAVLRARQGDLHLASALVQQLTSLPRVFPLVLDAMAPWAQAQLLRAQGQHAEAGQLMWAAGVERRDLGFPGSALLCWLLRSQACTPEELTELLAIWEQAPIPVLRPLLDLHVQMSQGDPERVLDALAASGPVGGRWLIGAAVTVIAEGRQQAGASPLTSQELLERTGPEVAEAAAAAGVVTEDPAALSDRELEVALLARSGLTNREIANRLYLSVRTVENHMYRTLRKLGLSSRAELADWEPDATAAG